jgi:hypothetical protein
LRGRPDHGFPRAANGTFTTFNTPWSILALALSINPAGAVTGYSLDASNLVQAFVWSR